MSSLLLYAFAFVLLTLSYKKSKQNTKKSLLKAWKALEGILPELLSIIMVIGILLAVLNPQMISTWIGGQSGWLGTIVSALIGSVTLIPGFIAFPTAAMLLQHGAGYMQIGAFISTLMMVGVITAPVEVKFFGKKLTLLRNIFAFFFSFIVAYIIRKVVTGI